MVRFDAPGGDAELLGLYFADDGQHFESRLLVDHAKPNCKPMCSTRCAARRSGIRTAGRAHRVDRRCKLIRAEATGTDTFEVNRI